MRMNQQAEDDTHNNCHHDDDDSSLELEKDDGKFNMIVNKFFQKESFGKGFILNKANHIHSNYKATCDQDTHFMVLNKKGLIKIHERTHKK